MKNLTAATTTRAITQALFFPGGAPTIVPDPSLLLTAVFALRVARRTRSVLCLAIPGMIMLAGIAAAAKLADYQQING